MPDPDGVMPADRAVTRSTRSLWIRRAALLAFALLCAREILNLVGRIHWDEVLDGISHLTMWQVAAMVALVLVRQVLNAWPLALFTDGLSLPRAVGVDQGSTLISMVGPPTSDTVFRIAVLRGWGIDTPRAVAGSTLNILAFYLARWLAPAVGFLLLLGSRFDSTYAVVAAGCLPVALAILGAMVVLTKTRALAERTGRWAGRQAQRLRRSVEPEGWADWAGEFQTHAAVRFRNGIAPAILILLVMFLVDAFILVCAIRFVGVGGPALGWVEVVAAFLVAFPLTLFPLHGIGLLDATVVAALTTVGGVHLEADLIAGLISYRVVTLGTPAAMGMTFLAVWRHTKPTTVDADPETRVV
jgi:uncharacterized membrane protein YbhN (UPF0104 family)